MKASSLVFLIIFGFIACLLVENQVTIVDAQENKPYFSGIDIISPSNTTYSSNLLPPLTVNVTRLMGDNIYVFMNYSLDGQSNQSIPLSTEQPMGSVMVVHTGSINLTNLSEGSHNTTVYAEFVYPSSASQQTNVTAFYNKTVYFDVVASTKTPAATEMPTATNPDSPNPSASPTEQQTPQPTDSSAPSPTVPEFSFWIVVSILIAVTMVTLYTTRGKKTLTLGNNPTWGLK